MACLWKPGHHAMNVPRSLMPNLLLSHSPHCFKTSPNGWDAANFNYSLLRTSQRDGWTFSPSTRNSSQCPRQSPVGGKLLLVMGALARLWSVTWINASNDDPRKNHVTPGLVHRSSDEWWYQKSARTLMVLSRSSSRSRMPLVAHSCRGLTFNTYNGWLSFLWRGKTTFIQCYLPVSIRDVAENPGERLASKDLILSAIEVILIARLKFTKKYQR